LVDSLVVEERVAMNDDGLTQLATDPQRGIETTSRILRDVCDQSATGVLQFFATQRQDIDATDGHPTACDAQTLARQAEKSHANGTLARAGLSHQAKDLTGGHPERDVFDDRRSASFGDDCQALHDQAV
jgi:hypothetical protein